jgi:hypothetical protein
MGIAKWIRNTIINPSDPPKEPVDKKDPTVL